jgi:hypothetical protein
MVNPSHPATPLAQLSCGYRNSTDRMVIVRCIGPEEFFLERVVFPFELLSFLAPAEAAVQIWTHGLGGPELIESFETRELQVEPPVEQAHLSLAPEPLIDWQEQEAV